MISDLEHAIELLNRDDYTCVLCKGQAIHTSTHRGVSPLLELLQEDVTGFSAADKVVGKATALLYCLLGISAVHAAVISEPALEVLLDHGIAVSFGQKVPHIINRSGTGICPVELATTHISDPRKAPDAIRAALKKLQNESQ